MIKRTLPWDSTLGNGAMETCERCSMMVMKYRETEHGTPRYAALEGRDDSGHYVGTLVNGTRCRLDPKGIRVEWIRNFAG